MPLGSVCEWINGSMNGFTTAFYSPWWEQILWMDDKDANWISISNCRGGGSWKGSSDSPIGIWIFNKSDWQIVNRAINTQIMLDPIIGGTICICLHLQSGSIHLRCCCNWFYCFHPKVIPSNWCCISYRKLSCSHFLLTMYCSCCTARSRPAHYSYHLFMRINYLLTYLGY